MYTITVETNSGIEKEFNIVDREYAIFYFNAFMKAIDVVKVVMTDGLTGELILEYSHGEICVF